MKNSTVNIALVTIIIIIFTGYFLILNSSFQKDITENLKLAEKYAINEEWDKVLETSIDIKESWNSKKHFLMLNFAEAEFTMFENHLGYIMGGAKAKQLDTTLSNILAAQDIWINIRKIVPEP
ncbi:hypothetical protein BD780_002902 [Clostridium tetanomorphum]|uniref:DUF4363 family protein n=1 Tax=Clostridium tetanomorphum TaxID=1553 RepID=A0A923E8V7_CLOTT|nr:DUF4363 family protein [Clostridium tetanomorphum]KAJ53755.1 hypothetical protein CTM_00760 [Clostridium tetanomorphum DSM 665]MBC2397266.1 DUF4363 family protein [Clostridium tetanomorphum]MBP1862483.1 hypothetical protein [Clostridium tetanomorphum]NRS85677.1 hypothetical protein [Clostridium tetanomorphum]NRZ96313.1 hypothetical protein [Clostridium tetanomorphum]